MPDAPRLLTLAEVAERVGRHPKTLRRQLPVLMQAYPALSVRKLGRSILFTEGDYLRLVEAIQWLLPSGSGARSGTRAAPSASAARSSRSQSSAQERLRAALRSKSPSVKPRASARKSLMVLPGGRGT